MNPAWAATTGAQPWICVVSSREPLWKPAVRESPRKMVLEKLPAFLACWAWRASCCLVAVLGLSLLQPKKRSAAARLEGSRTERLFIFMATNGPLRDVANLEEFAAGVLSLDVALYHTRGAMGNKRYLVRYLRKGAATVG